MCFAARSMKERKKEKMIYSRFDINRSKTSCKFQYFKTYLIHPSKGSYFNYFLYIITVIIS